MTAQTQQPASAPTKKRRSFGPGAVFALLGMNVTIVGVTMFLAVRDTTFGVEPNYYQKAVDWDAFVAQVERNRALGWSMRVVDEGGFPAAVRLLDGAGEPLSGAELTAVVFHHARSRDRRELSLMEGDASGAPGVYGIPAGAIAAPGLWELRLAAERGSARFTAELTHSVGGESAR